MALSNDLINDLGIASHYHRIERVEMDYDHMQMHIILACYADASYREAEKAEIAENAALLAELDALQTEYDADPTAFAQTDKMTRYVELYNQRAELEAGKYTPRSMREARHTLDITPEIRAAVYDAIKAQVPDFAGAEDV